MRFLLLAVAFLALSGQVVYEPAPQCEISVETCDGSDCVRLCFPDG